MPPAIKRIFIVDDHQVVIDALRLLLSGIPGFEIIGCTTMPMLVTGILKDIEIDILITDVSMPGMNGIELTRAVKNMFPQIKVMTLSMFGDSHIVAEMIDAGASAYLLKNSGRKEMKEALEKVSAGILYFSADIKFL